MRKGLFFTLLFIFPVILAAQIRDEEKERQRIAVSKIKSVTQWAHRYSQGKPNPTGYKTTETQYDKQGNAIEIVNYRSNGEISTRLLYKYNEQNLRIEYIMFQKFEKPELEPSYKQIFFYNKKGLKIQENITDRVGAFKIVNNYYPNDQIKEIIKYGAGNVIEEKWEYTYTADSQEIKIFSTDNILTAIIRKKFDSKGNLLDETRTDAKGNETKRTSYTYDSKARLASMAEYFSGKISKTLYYKYNNFDLVEEITQENPDGQKFTQASYKYDPKGNLLEERWSEDSTEEFSHKQSRYDKDGNLLEMDSYFAPYRYRVFYKYTYEYYK